VLTAADIALRTPRVEGAMGAHLFDLAIGGVLLVDKAADEPLHERHRGDSGDGIT
jgi:hypothetical protein